MPLDSIQYLPKPSPCKELRSCTFDLNRTKSYLCILDICVDLHALKLYSFIVNRLFSN